MTFFITAHWQGRNEGGQGEHNSPGANLLRGHWITAGVPNYCWRRRKVPTMSQVLSSIQWICLWRNSDLTIGAPNFDHGAPVRPGGRRICFLPQAPS